jgi:hypothetical protein
VQLKIIETAGGKATIGVARIARHLAELDETKRAVQGLRRIAGAHVEQQQRATRAQRQITRRVHERSRDAAAAVRAPHHQLHHLGAVPTVGPRLQAELHCADQTVVLEGNKQRDAPLTQARRHALPIRLNLGTLERQDKADRGAAPDGVLEQLDQLIRMPSGLTRLERADADQLAGAVQVGRPSIGYAGSL